VSGRGTSYSPVREISSLHSAGKRLKQGKDLTAFGGKGLRLKIDHIDELMTDG